MLQLVCDNVKGTPGRLSTPQSVRTFLTSGHAVFTLVSRKTGVRYTYKVDKPKGEWSDWNGRMFVAMLSGPDNENDYQYLGLLEDGKNFRLTKKSRLSIASVPVKAFCYFLLHICVAEQMPPDLEVWHEGKCGRCGRTLTVPESIERGIGPECAAKMGLT